MPPIAEEVITKDGVKISIRHLKADNGAVVIVAPGFFQSKETKTFTRIANDIHQHFDVIAMDMRGHGKSEGKYAFSAKEKEDLRAVVEYARGHYKHVGVIGFSYSGSITILTQAAYKNIDSIIAVTAPMAGNKIEYKWWHPESFNLALHAFERGSGVRSDNPFLKKTYAIDVVSHVAPTPILFIHSKNDPTVGIRHSRALYEAAQEPKRLEIWEKGSHAQEMYRQFPKKFIGLVVDWFEETLK